MPRTWGGAARDGPPLDVQHATQLAERQQQPTAAGPVALRRRRDAALRLPPMKAGRRDPLDGLAGKPVRIVEWGGYDVRTLGLACRHDDGCPACGEAV
ncbi:MAG: hypothetical protein ACRDPY_32850 [Streptosporangiaceae bacterium]